MQNTDAALPPVCLGTVNFPTTFSGSMNPHDGHMIFLLGMALQVAGLYLQLILLYNFYPHNFF